MRRRNSTGSVAAGGVTTIGNMTFPWDGQSLSDAIARDLAAAERTASVDYILHPVLLNPTPEAVAEVPRLAADGACPDLVSATVGMNDIRDGEFNPADFAVRLGQLLEMLAGTGATVLTCTLPDIAGVVPLPPEYVEIARRRLSGASDIIRDQAARHGAICLDTWAMRDVAASPELFTADRLHPNTSGHRRLAEEFADLLLAG